MSSPVEQIKERLDIVDLVRSYVRLEKAGANFKARCPFHSEKTPSFFVSSSRQMWHCFGCEKGGDHFDFIQEIEGVEFSEALKLLAERTGIELRKEDPQVRSERARLLSLLDDATAFYEANLLNYKDAGDYLKQRGMTGKTAKAFRLGYAKDEWDGLLSYLTKKGYREEEIEKTGLLIKKEQGGYYDRFRARIMFPLFDSSGRIVGFSGRIFPESDDKDVPKYINTPQTILYDKSKVLYGFYRAKQAIRKHDAAVLVEGQMDVVLSHQAGVTNAIAVSGTSLTEQHLNALQRLTTNLVMSFDMDSAGLNAAQRGVSLALSQGFEVHAVALPEGNDPADLIAKSSELWHNALSEAKPVIAFFLEAISRATDNTRERAKQIRERIYPYVMHIINDTDRWYWAKEIARTIQSPEEPVWKELESLRVQNARRNPSRSSESQANTPGQQAKTRKDILEERILGILFWQGADIAEQFAQSKTEWFSSERRPFFTALISGTKDTGDDHYLKKLALEAEIAYNTAENITGEVRHLLDELKKEHMRERITALTAEIRIAEEAGNRNAVSEKMNELHELSQKLHRTAADHQSEPNQKNS